MAYLVGEANWNQFAAPFTFARRGFGRHRRHLQLRAPVRADIVPGGVFPASRPPVIVAGIAPDSKL